MNSIREITLKTTTPIAGDAMLYDNGGHPDFHSGQLPDDQWFSSIRLSGDFVAGKEYCIALWPKEMNGFELTFSDGEGNFTTLRSQKKITPGRSVVIDIGTIELGHTFKGLGAISTDRVLYMSATEGDKPVSIVIIPDGFTFAELPMYETLAKMAIDFIFDTEPYKSYKNRFNAWILKAASNESGGGVTDSNGNEIIPVDNYFGTKWPADNYSRMWTNENTVIPFVSSNCPDVYEGVHTIQEVPIIILINDTRVGGLTKSSADGKAYSMCPWFRSGAAVNWAYPTIVPLSESDPKGGYRNRTAEDIELVKYSPGDWRNTLMYEFCHAFGRLEDEYWGSPAMTAPASKITQHHNWEVPFGKNISASYSTTPWDMLLQRKADLSARDSLYSRIGKYQGGFAGYIFGCWRSERVSGMVDCRQYLNAWCRYLVAQRIMKLSGNEDDFTFDY